jgi:hypothetical protein
VKSKVSKEIEEVKEMKEWDIATKGSNLIINMMSSVVSPTINHIRGKSKDNDLK